MKLRTRQTFHLAWLAFTVAGLSSADAQPLKKIPRIGVLVTSSPLANSQRIEAFRQGLRELGYLEGKDILIEYRYGDGKPERLPTLAGQLVAMKVDVIIMGGSSLTQAAKDACSFEVDSPTNTNWKSTEHSNDHGDHTPIGRSS